MPPLPRHALPIVLAIHLGCTPGPQAKQGSAEAAASKGAEWVDPSPHRAGSVQANGARLHYLDWGGQGEVVILLPGLGSSAHAFDDIAPRLADRFRVLALTPRAHGESSTPDTLYTVSDAADDLLGLMDALGIRRAHLVGHSISGSAITRLAALHPERVGKLVYLDATFDYGGADEKEMDEKVLPRPEPQGGADPAAAYRDWARRYFFGTWSPALEADQRAGALAEGNDEQRRAAARGALLADVTAHPKEYGRVRAPALALWAEKTMESHYFWVDPADAQASARAREYLRLRRAWEQAGVDRFRREIPDGRVVAFPAHHWMFITHQDRVLRELRSFLGAR